MLANQVFRKLKVLTNVNIFIMKTFITLLLLLSFGSVRAADLFIEAESFSNKGGWKVDQQFMDLMGLLTFWRMGWVYPSMMPLRK